MADPSLDVDQAVAAPPAGPEHAHRARDASHVARSGSLQILAALGQGLLPVYQILVARLFGAHAQGVFATCVAYLEITGRAAIAGSDRALLRYIAAHRIDGSQQQVAQALGAALRLSLSMAVVALVLLLSGAGVVARLTGFPEAGTTLRVMSPTVLAFVLVLVLVAATLGARTSRVHLAVRGIAEPAFLMTGALLAYAAGAGLTGLALAHALAFFAAAGLALVGARWVLGGPVVRQAIAGPALPGFKRFALPLGISELTTVVLQRADIVILGAFVDASAVAFYFAAEQLSRSVGGVRHALDGVAAPLLSEALRQNDRPRLQASLTLLTRWTCLAAAPIGAAAFVLRPELLSLFGPQHRAAAPAMALLLAGQLSSSILGLAPVVLVMGGRSGLFMWCNLGAAITNVGLNLLLVPRLGLVGAGIASLAAVLGLQVVLAIITFVLSRVHPLSWPLFKTLLGGGVVWLYATAVKALVPLPTGLTIVLVLAGGALVYGLTLLALGLAPEEKLLARKLWARLTGRAGRPLS